MVKIRLISDTAPTDRLTAGIVLEQVIKNFGASIEWTANILVDDRMKGYPVSKYLPNGSVSWYRKPQESHLCGLIGKIFSRPVELLAKIDLEPFIENLVVEESRSSSDLILIVIQGQSSYRVACRLFDAGYPVSLIFWDPWQWWEREKSVPANFQRIVESVHAHASKNGVHLLPTRKFGLSIGIPDERIVVLYPHFSDFKARNDTKSKLGNSTGAHATNIVMVGQEYTPDELACFVEYAQEAGGLGFRHPIILHKFGAFSKLTGRNVVHHPWIHYAQIADEIRHFDFALMPYPASLRMREVAQQSFPSKLAQYVTSSLPIIYVGPQSSSVLDFLQPTELPVPLLEIRKGPNGDESIYLGIFDNFTTQEYESIYEQNFSAESQDSSLQSWLKLNGINLNPTIIEKITFPTIDIRDCDRIKSGRMRSILAYRLILVSARVFHRFLMKVYISSSQFKFIILLMLKIATRTKKIRMICIIILTRIKFWNNL
jgi:hypothetical protein